MTKGTNYNGGNEAKKKKEMANTSMCAVIRRVARPVGLHVW